MFKVLSGLHPDTQQMLSWLPVYRDMEAGLNFLVGFHDKKRLPLEEEKETMLLSATGLEMELKRMITELKPLSEIASLSLDDWKKCQ